MSNTNLIKNNYIIKSSNEFIIFNKFLHFICVYDDTNTCDHKIVKYSDSWNDSFNKEFFTYSGMLQTFRCIRV